MSADQSSGGLVRDKNHPRGSPLLGKILSRTVCALGHEIVIMDMDTWDEKWLACSVCGARFMPADMIDDDTDIVKI